MYFLNLETNTRELEYPTPNSVALERGFALDRYATHDYDCY